MHSQENKGSRCLFVAQYGICKKLIDDDTRLEYIYRYTKDNHWIKFVNYSIRSKVEKEDAEDIFEDSVIAIYLKIEDNQVVIKCENIPKQWTNFLAYFWRILRNKLMDQLRSQGETIPIENEHGRNVNNVIPKKSNPDIDSGDLVKIFKYILENLDENDRKRYQIYIEDNLSHEQVSESGFLKSEGSSRTTKSRLILRLRNEWERIVNNDQLLDNIRWKYQV